MKKGLSRTWSNQRNNKNRVSGFTLKIDYTLDEGNGKGYHHLDGIKVERIRESAETVTLSKVQFKALLRDIEWLFKEAYPEDEIQITWEEQT